MKQPLILSLLHLFSFIEQIYIDEFLRTLNVALNNILKLKFNYLELKTYWHGAKINIYYSVCPFKNCWFKLLICVLVYNVSNGKLKPIKVHFVSFAVIKIRNVVSKLHFFVWRKVLYKTFELNILNILCFNNNFDITYANIDSIKLYLEWEHKKPKRKQW